MLMLLAGGPMLWELLFWKQELLLLLVRDSN